jgi:hypothetical protein
MISFNKSFSSSVIEFPQQLGRVCDVCVLSLANHEMLRKLSQTISKLESKFFNIFTPFRSQDMLMPSFVGAHPEMRHETNLPSISEIIGDIFRMAAPKSKVSHE